MRYKACARQQQLRSDGRNEHLVRDVSDPKLQCYFCSNLRILKLFSYGSSFGFQNRLVDLNQKTKYNFILTDPRGELNGSDLYYDLGKLWHSFHGLYDFMHEDLFDVKVRVQDSNVTARLEFEDIPAFSEYKRIHELFPKWLKEYPPLCEDPYWEMRTLLAEAAHFCSVMPFHLKMDNVEKRAIALYLTGVKLLNEFVEKYKIKEWEEDLSWINVNTSEDYMRAIKLLRKQKEATL